MRHREPLHRWTPLRRRGRDGRERPAVYGAYHRWITGLPCLLRDRESRCWGPVQGHHVRSVGAGGTDVGNEVPLCFAHHRAVHRQGCVSFEAEHAVDLRAEARALEARWRREKDSDGP